MVRTRIGAARFSYPREKDSERKHQPQRASQHGESLALVQNDGGTGMRNAPRRIHRSPKISKPVNATRVPGPRWLRARIRATRTLKKWMNDVEI